MAKEGKAIMREQVVENERTVGGRQTTVCVKVQDERQWLKMYIGEEGKANDRRATQHVM